MVHQKAIITGSWIKMVSHFHTQREREAAFADYTFNLSTRSLTQMSRRHSFTRHVVYPTTYFRSIANPLSSDINVLISDEIQQDACCQLKRYVEGVFI